MLGYYCYLRCTVAIFAERCVLEVVFLVPIVQFAYDGTAQHAFAFTVNEDYFLLVLVLILFQCGAENAQLIFQNIACGQPCCGLQHLFGVQIYNNFIVFKNLFGIFCFTLTIFVSPHQRFSGWLQRGLGWLGVAALQLLRQFYLLVQLCFFRLFFFGYGVKQCRCIEEIVLAEGVQLVKLGGIYAYMRIECGLALERISRLVGKNLYARFGNVV